MHIIGDKRPDISDKLITVRNGFCCKIVARRCAWSESKIWNCGQEQREQFAKMVGNEGSEKIWQQAQNS